jgi:hypothetical protein
MRLRRVKRIASLVAAALAAGASPALAARNLSGVPDNLTEVATSPDFAVHYTTAPGDPNATTPDDARHLLLTAERALGDSVAQLGLPRPLDADGRSDIYVFQSSHGSEPGTVRADSTADQSTGWIAVPPSATGDTFAVAHLVVHLQQLALYRPAGRALAEGSATWAPLYLYSSELTRLPDQAQFFADDSLDCTDSTRCARPGFGSWPFFELLAERYGPGVVRAIYDKSRELGAADHRPHFIEALEAVLFERQATLPGTFSDFTRANLVGDYALQGLAKRRYGATEPFDDLATGSRSRRFRARAVRLDHLAGAFYRLRSGTDSPPAARPSCAAARLRIRIDGPSDLEAPLFWAPFRPHPGRARAFFLSSGHATVEMPWTTCTGREAGVAVYNPSPGIDGRIFRLRIELVVSRRRR